MLPVVCTAAADVMARSAQPGLTFLGRTMPWVCTAAADVTTWSVQTVCVLVVHLGHALDDPVRTGWSFLGHMLPFVCTAAADFATWSAQATCSLAEHLTHKLYNGLHTGLSFFLAHILPLLCAAAATGSAAVSTAVSAMAEACPVAFGLARQATIYGRDVAAALESSPGLVFILVAVTSIALWWENRREEARASAAAAGAEAVKSFDSFRFPGATFELVKKDSTRTLRVWR